MTLEEPPGRIPDQGTVVPEPATPNRLPISVGPNSGPCYGQVHDQHEGGSTMLKSRAAAVGVGSVALALGATIGFAGTASAATPQGVCGSGYTVRASKDLGAGPNARVYLLRNGTTACVVTFKTGSSVGNTVEIGAWIGDASGYSNADVGKYGTYAGPIKLNSSCVYWGGHYGSSSWYDKTGC
jgi:hypothetical protein